MTADFMAGQTTAEPQRGNVRQLTEAALSCAEVAALASGEELVLSPEVRALVEASREIVDEAVQRTEPVYGLNTGLGHRRNERVSAALLQDYQPYIIRTHAGAIGAPLSEPDVRATMVARIVGIARGGAGVGLETLDLLVAMLNRRVHPQVPEFGSVGASDLCSMSAIAEVMIGRGVAMYQGELMPAMQALAAAGLAPVRLKPKEGLALISGNGLAIGAGALTVERARRVLRLADLAGALSLDAYGGNPVPLDPRVQAAKSYPEQAETGQRLRELLAGSAIWTPSPTARSLQDPVSFRTIPQVHGAVRRQVCEAATVVEVELNSRSDNPLVDVGSGAILSNGNFQALPIALAFDGLRTGICHIASMSERRCSHVFRKLQAMSSIDDAIQNAEMPVTSLVAYSAAELSARLRTLAAPASIHVPSLAHDVEDHGSLGPGTIAFTAQSLDLLEMLLAVEIHLSAALADCAGASDGLGEGTRAAYRLAGQAMTRSQETGRPTTAGVIDLLRNMLVEHCA